MLGTFSPFSRYLLSNTQTNDGLRINCHCEYIRLLSVNSVKQSLLGIASADSFDYTLEEFKIGIRGRDEENL